MKALVQGHTARLPSIKARAGTWAAAPSFPELLSWGVGSPAVCICFPPNWEFLEGCPQVPHHLRFSAALLVGAGRARERRGVVLFVVLCGVLCVVLFYLCITQP